MHAIMNIPSPLLTAQRRTFMFGQYNASAATRALRTVSAVERLRRKLVGVGAVTVMGQVQVQVQVAALQGCRRSSYAKG
jgi:hypothetical protein